jgi:hypothetical protein
MQKRLCERLTTAHFTGNKVPKVACQMMILAPDFPVLLPTKSASMA